MSAKQDRQGARTVSDLERKYNFGKNFAEVLGIATDARDAAENAQSAADGAQKAADNAQKAADDAQKSADSASGAVSKLDTKLNHDEIFNRLTKNGTLQGLYRENGDMYFNAAYIRSLEELFAKNITMTGTFESSGEAYLPPTYESILYMLWHINFPDLYPLPSGYESGYDLNKDGKVDINDLDLAMAVYQGTQSLSACAGGKKSAVTMRINMSNTASMIQISGVNQWGYNVSCSIGTDPGTCSFALRENVDRMVRQDVAGSNLYRFSNGDSGEIE